MRVLYLQPAPLFGGAERQAATNVPLLCELGLEVVPVVGPGTAIADWLRERGVSDFVHTDCFPGGGLRPRGLARLSLPHEYRRCVARTERLVAGLVNERGIDVILAAMPFSWVASTEVARRLGVAIVWRAGGTEITAMQKAALWTWGLRRAPDLLLCNGDAVRRTYAPLVRAPAAVVPNGVDIEQFRPGDHDPRRYRPPGARLAVGFAARLVSQKRPQDFIDLAARLAQRRPDVAFLLAGEGSRRAAYQKLAERAGASNLHFLGYVSDMRAFYSAIDVLVLPSRSEGCPNVVLEAMAMDTVVVASDAAGTVEVLRHGREGLVYPIADVSRLTALVDDLAARPGRVLALRRAAALRVRSRFDARTCAAGIAGELQAVLEAATSPALVGAGAMAGRRLSAAAPRARPGR
jgi:glycosyltransferase involved in cell wall biosynthesis